MAIATPPGATVPRTVTESWKEAWKRAEMLFYADYPLPADLPLTAARALSAGWESEHLILLAGESPGVDPRHLRDLFRLALTELERSPMTFREALTMLARYQAERIVAGTVEPITGARMIARLPWLSGGDDREPLPEALEFDMLDDEWMGGWGRTRAELERAIRNQARALLSRPVP